PQNTIVKKNSRKLADAPITQVIRQENVKSNESDSLYKDLYLKQKSEYDILFMAYNELMKTNTDLKKKNEDLGKIEGFFKNEKHNLIKELDDKDNEKHSLKQQMAEVNQKLLEKDNTIKAMQKTISIHEERKQKDENELRSLKKEIDEMNTEKETLIKDYKNKIYELERKLIEGREGSIGEISSGNVEALGRELNKEREKYNIIIKNKEEEIKKLNEEKNSIKENEAKKYEKIFNKYE